MIAQAPAVAEEPRSVAVIDTKPRGRLRFGRVSAEAAVVAGFALLTAILTYPLVLNLTTAVPGDGTDSWIFYWDLWWVKRALLDLQTNPYFATDVHYPFGASLYFHTLFLVPAVIALPLGVAFGLTAAYNLLVLFAFVAGGYGAYRLVLYVVSDEAAWPYERTHRRLAAFIGGAVFTFSSYHFAHLLGHLNLVSLQWLPFYVLYLVKTWRESGWRNPLIAALFLALTSLTEWSYALFLLLFTVFVVAYALVADRRRADLWRSLCRVGATVGAYVLATSPILLPMLVAGRSSGRVPDPAGDAVRFSADLLAFIVPSPLHPVWGLWMAPVNELLTPSSRAESVVFLGSIPLLLGAWAIASIWARRRFWLVAFGLFTLLALGPVLQVAGEPARVAGGQFALPYQLLQQLPYLDISRVPSRLTVMSTLCLAVLAGHASLMLLRRARKRGQLGAAFALLLGGIVFEQLAAPYPMAPVAIPPVYAQLGQDPRRLAVLEVPIPDDPQVHLERMLFQTEHAKPTYGGVVSRGLPPLPVTALPGFAQLEALDMSTSDIVVYDTEHLPAIGRAVLDAYKFGYVVVDKGLLEPADVERARSVAAALLGARQPWHEDELTLTYAAQPAPTAAPAFVYLDQGWYELERAPSDAPADAPARWRWMADDAQLRVVVPRPGNYRLTLRAWAFREPTRVAILLEDTPLPSLDVSAELATYEIPVFAAEPGSYALHLRSLHRAQTPQGTDQRRLSVAVTEIRLDPELRSDQTSLPTGAARP